MPSRIASCIVLCLLSALGIALAFWHAPTFTLEAPSAPVLSLSFGVSDLARPFLLVIGVVSPAIALWSLGHGKSGHLALLTVFVTTMMGVLVAQSVAAFFLTWESMALASALLVASRGEWRYVRRAALAYLAMSQLGAFCVLIALALLASHAPDASFASIAKAAASIPEFMRIAILVLALIGFGSKAGLVPLHFWLPRAHPAAPANASAALSGLMLAVAIYGLMQVTLSLASPVPARIALILIGLGLLSCLAGGLYASIDTDLKRLLAYSSIENIGVMSATLGIALLASRLGAAAVASLAIVALLFHVTSHALFKSLLFLVAGTIAEAFGTTDLERLGGSWKTLRFAAPVALIGCMAGASLPPTSGFASEWLVFRSFIVALGAAPLLLRLTAAIAVTGVAIGASLATIGYVKAFALGFLGNRRAALQSIADAPTTPAIGFGWLAFGIVVLGLVPGTFIAALARVSQTLAPGVPDAGSLTALPATLVFAPILAMVAMLPYLATRVRYVPTWTCGTYVPARVQYSAGAFSNPLTMIFSAVLAPVRERIFVGRLSKWFPERISYRACQRYVIDEYARSAAAFVQKLARRTRIVQGGSLRSYLAYAALALAILLVIAR